MPNRQRHRHLHPRLFRIRHLGFAQVLYLAATVSTAASFHQGRSVARLKVHIPTHIVSSDPSGFFPVVSSEFGVGNAARRGGGSVAGELTGDGDVVERASFVAPPQSLAQYVYFVNATLCAPIAAGTSAADVWFPTTATTRQSPFLLLAMYDPQCSPVTQVRHAQHVGAAAMLLIEASSTAATEETPRTTMAVVQADTASPSFVDDGSGGDISIPSMTLDKALGDALIRHIGEKNQPALVEVQWGLPPPSNDSKDPVALRPKVHLWTTPYDTDMLTVQQYRDLQTVVLAFRDDEVDFEPRFAIHDGSIFGCRDHDVDETGNEICHDVCSNNGRYCGFGYGTVNVTGSTIMAETLRRLCVWDQVKDKDRGSAYWDYVIHHKDLCKASDGQFADSKCIASAMKATRGGVQHKLVDLCMSDTGDLSADVTNTMLDASLGHLRHTGVTSFPAVTVSHKPVPTPDARLLFELICTEHWMSPSRRSLPKSCELCGSCPNAVGCLAHGHCMPFGHSKKSNNSRSSSQPKGHGGRIFWLLMMILFLMGGAYYYYDTHLRPVDGDRSGLLNDYFHLSSEG